MLDNDTKRKIDAARDILVGKVPDPKAQVEQITTALVYKFMDDMDKESQELGGKASFFANDFEKYSWSKLLDRRLSGTARLGLFVEAIAMMSTNRHIPQLFRDIFKGAFLPYRDPETLSLFLKEIDGFTYDHSENLGNAFEYLLSVLGSQGDAGQFRTPRHIIDFIIAVVDPDKKETILDPACGTAGFLISAYKHILEKNEKPPLTPDEKTKLMDNIVGYDISPDMVKLSLVNMYLHGFQSPQIHEYDTLTSEQRWDEQFNVIVANPPFMSPRGGIRPHQRFSVQASRSEVLFVDYILEHLRINGRAGIIVPEGIIFKAQNAYKQLRKMLVENGLFAVASLPQGVFKPYSGVKTSILLVDNERVAKKDEILFFEIHNDGFDLGDKRQPIDKNDLPEAREVLTAWKQGKKQKSELALWVKKNKIAESDDYNLIGERYREIEIYKNVKWQMVELGKVLDYEQPTKYIVKSTNYNDSNKTPVLTAGKSFILGYTSETDGIFSRKKLPVIIFDDFTTAIKFVDMPFKVKSSAMKILNIIDKNKTNIRFIFLAMQNIRFNVGRHKRYWISEYCKLKISLPPLEVQKKIVEQIQVKQNAINHAKEIIKNLERERRYFGNTLRKLENIEWVELGKVCEIYNGSTPIRSDESYWNDGEISWFTIEDIRNQGRIIKQTAQKITQKALDKTSVKLLPPKTILLCCTASVGEYAITEIETTTNQQFNGLVVKDEYKEKLIPYFLFFLSGNFKDELIRLSGKTSFNFVSVGTLKKMKIPFPPLVTQKQLVAEAEKEEAIITANRRLIEMMEKKIGEVIAEI